MTRLFGLILHVLVFSVSTLPALAHAEVETSSLHFNAPEITGTGNIPNPGTGDIIVDSSTTPPTFKGYNGNAWVGMDQSAAAKVTSPTNTQVKLIRGLAFTTGNGAGCDTMSPDGLSYTCVANSVGDVTVEFPAGTFVSGNIPTCVCSAVEHNPGIGYPSACAVDYGATSESQTRMNISYAGNSGRVYTDAFMTFMCVGQSE